MCRVIPQRVTYQICCGLLYVRELKPKVNFFTYVEFRGFQQSLDTEMKQLQSERIGITQKRVEPISVKEEGELWEKGILGDSSPQVLLGLLLWSVLCFKEWGKNTAHSVTQLQLFEPPGE